MSDDKPLPCPFCGNNTVYTAVDAGQGNKWGFAHCGQCGAQSGDVRTGYDEALDAPWRAEAIAEWNNRALPPVPAPDVAELVEAAKGIIPLVDCDVAGEPDNQSIGWHQDGKPIAVTFGQVRASFAILAKIKEPTP